MRGKKMQGIGCHYSTMAGRPVTGHSLVVSLYVLLGRRCPLASQLYRQKKTCVAEGMTFRSKVALMEATIRDFVPVEGTCTHVLLDAWYSAKVIWRAARERGFEITTGLKGNRLVRIRDKRCRGGWQWLSLDAYALRLKDEDYTEVIWPRRMVMGKRSTYMSLPARFRSSGVCS